MSGPPDEWRNPNCRHGSAGSGPEGSLAELLDGLAGIQLVHELIQLVQVDPGIEAEVMRLDLEGFQTVPGRFWRVLPTISFLWSGGRVRGHADILWAN
jgi:hypothetical protein